VNSLVADGRKVGLHCRFEISILAKRVLARWERGEGGFAFKHFADEITWGYWDLIHLSISYRHFRGSNEWELIVSGPIFDKDQNVNPARVHRKPRVGAGTRGVPSGRPTFFNQR
jgi:hypothetical protein